MGRVKTGPKRNRFERPEGPSANGLEKVRLSTDFVFPKLFESPLLLMWPSVSSVRLSKRDECGPTAVGCTAHIVQLGRAKRSVKSFRLKRVFV